MPRIQSKYISTNPINILAVTLVMIVYLVYEGYLDKTTTLFNYIQKHIRNGKNVTRKRQYNITWYNMPYYMSQMHDAIHAGFSSCDYTNCRMWFGPNNVNYSDGVIFDGRNVKQDMFFKRRPGQILILSAQEAPISFNDIGPQWKSHFWVSGYNWTMTYDKSNTDIHLPYGEIQKRGNIISMKNYGKIFRKKNISALIVHSHCPTRSKRESYVKSLQKFIDIDSYGKCGKPWNCGLRFNHESGNCFDKINDYKFYLAFENAFCNQYFTEKLFRNYNYDSIMVIRGECHNDTHRLLPKGTFISTDDFKSIKELADYMKMIGDSEKLYIEMLKRKDEFYSVPYKTVYQRAMCELCERMNNQEKYRKEIKSIIQWDFGQKQCENPSEITDVNELH